MTLAQETRLKTALNHLENSLQMYEKISHEFKKCKQTCKHAIKIAEEIEQCLPIKTTT